MQRDRRILWFVHSSLADIGSLAAARGRHQRALRLVGAESALEERADRLLPAMERRRLDRWIRAARERGRAISPEQAVAEAVEDADARALGGG